MPSIVNVEGPRTLLALRALLAVFFLYLALKSLSGDARMTEDFRRWGYPDGFRLVVALAQLAGAAALFITPLTFPAAVGLSLLLLGAVGTHLRHDPPLSAMPALVCLLLLLPVLWTSRPVLLR
jgi:uncharacterized membrane protein YphA (DoxX/SURF4 family)